MKILTKKIIPYFLVLVILVIVKAIKNSKAKKQEEFNHYKEIENKIDQINEKLNDL